jgi:hypothetical protein
MFHAQSNLARKVALVGLISLASASTAYSQTTVPLLSLGQPWHNAVASAAQIIHRDATAIVAATPRSSGLTSISEATICQGYGCNGLTKNPAMPS